MKDPIVEEVRKARQDHARKFNYDLNKICDDLKRIEKDCGHTLVSLLPRLLTKASIRAQSTGKVTTGGRPQG